MIVITTATKANNILKAYNFPGAVINVLHAY